MPNDAEQADGAFVERWIAGAMEDSALDSEILSSVREFTVQGVLDDKKLVDRLCEISEPSDED